MKEQKHGKKRAWVKPEIRVLVRSSSEEAVLYGCKGKADGTEYGPASKTCEGWKNPQCSGSVSS